MLFACFAPSRESSSGQAHLDTAPEFKSVEEGALAPGSG